MKKFKEIKVSKKDLAHEAAKLSKKQKKAVAEANRRGVGESFRPTVFADKRREKTRPNVDRNYRLGKYD